MSSDFIHSREYLDSNEFVRVDCDTQCNVMLTDDTNFSRFRRGESFRYFGGHYKRFPVTLTPPHAGNWNVTIDLGGGSASIRYSINVVKSPSHSTI